MRVGAGTAPVALLIAALAIAGCGLGPGGGVGEVELTVTRDYGKTVLIGPVADGASESDTVLRVLDRNAEVATRFGGGFVEEIEGVESGRSAAGRHGWFFYVNGVESSVGAADHGVRAGEAIWWDYRDWEATPSVPAVVGSWPRPLQGGYDGARRPVAVECVGAAGACRAVRGRLAEAGVELAGLAGEDAIRVLVGPWPRLTGDAAAGAIGRGPRASGVFAEIGGPACRLRALDEEGRTAAHLGPRAGLVAATRRLGGPPVWVVTGCTGAGVAAAAGLLDAEALRDRYAVAVRAPGGAPIPLPRPAGGEPG